MTPPMFLLDYLWVVWLWPNLLTLSLPSLGCSSDSWREQVKGLGMGTGWQESIIAYDTVIGNFPVDASASRERPWALL